MSGGPFAGLRALTDISVGVPASRTAAGKIQPAVVGNFPGGADTPASALASHSDASCSPEDGKRDYYADGSLAFS